VRRTGRPVMALGYVQGEVRARCGWATGIAGTPRCGRPPGRGHGPPPAAHPPRPLRAYLSREVDVHPAGEEVAFVPLGLAMAEEHEFGHGKWYLEQERTSGCLHCMEAEQKLIAR